MSSHQKAAWAYAVAVLSLVAISFGPLSAWQSATVTIALALGAAIILAPTGGKR